MSTIALKSRLLRPETLAGTYYFLYFGAVGGLMPYLNLYYQQRGVTTGQIGILVATMTATTLLAGPVWSGIADRFHFHQRLLPGVLLMTVPAAALLALASTFETLGVALFLFFFMLGPAIPLADFAVLSLLGEKKHEYGKLRLWGAVGWGIGGWTAGQLIERWGMAFSFTNYVLLMLLCVWIASMLPAARQNRPPSYWLALRSLVQQMRWFGFMISLFLGGIAMTVYNNYLVLHMDALGAGEGLFGLGLAASSLSEIPVFLIVPLLLRRYSPRVAILAAFASILIRGFAYATITDPRWIVPVQMLHGLSFSAMWAAGVYHVNSMTPEGLGASAQAFFGMTFFSIAGVCGALLGSMIYEQQGSVALFQVSGMLGLSGLVLFSLTEILSAMTGKRKQ